MIPIKINHFGKILAMISIIVIIVGVGLYTDNNPSPNDISGAASKKTPEQIKKDAIDKVPPGICRIYDCEKNYEEYDEKNKVIVLEGGISIQEPTKKIPYWVIETGARGDEPSSKLYDNRGREVNDKGMPVSGIHRMFDTFDDLTTPTGLGYFSKYFFEQETLDAWREEVDRVFATYYLGTEYWESEICSLYADRTGEGVAYFNNKVGASGLASHVEASRSQAISTPPGLTLGNESQEQNQHGILQANEIYLYKITFAVRNGISEKDSASMALLRFNVYMQGSKESALFKNDVELTRGQSFTASGKKAIVQYSRNYYDTVCIRFDQLPLHWTLHENELCNFIPEPDTTPTYASSQQQTTTTQTNNENGINQI